MLFRKDGIGEETYEILQKIVENQENRKFRYEGEQTEEGTFRRLQLGYQLRSGREVKRSYVINTEECGELLYNLYKEENLKIKQNNFWLQIPHIWIIFLLFQETEEDMIFSGSAGKQKN